MRDRIRIAESLEINGWLAKPKIFVARKFNEPTDDLFNKMKKLFEPAFDVYEGKEMYGEAPIPDAIIDLIRKCHFFIGILTPDHGNVRYPSSYIMWEYGVARGHKGCLGLRILHDPKVSLIHAQPAIHIELHTFNGTDQLREQCETIRAKFAEIWNERKFPKIKSSGA